MGHSELLENTIRRYNHRRNNRLNIQLNLLVAIVMILVSGFGAGHYFGYTSHDNYKTYVSRIENELLSCHRDEQKTAKQFQTKIDELFFDNERLKHEMFAMKKQEVDSQRYREELNLLQNENADLKEIVAKLRY